MLSNSIAVVFEIVKGETQDLVKTNKKRHNILCRPACQKIFFDKLAEVKGAAKTSKPDSSAYRSTLESGLRSKSKYLAQQAFQGLKKNGLPRPQVACQ